MLTHDDTGVCGPQEPAQLPKLLAENLKIIDQRLFLRLAEMSDTEEDPYEQLRIRQLATSIASTVETILEQADAQILNLEEVLSNIEWTTAQQQVVEGLKRRLELCCQGRTDHFPLRPGHAVFTAATPKGARAAMAGFGAGRERSRVVGARAAGPQREP